MSAVTPLQPLQLGMSGEARLEAQIGSIQQKDAIAQDKEGLPSVTFDKVLASSIEDAAVRDRAASEKVDALASGMSDDLHGTMISVKEAEISLKLVASVRNKLLDAFHELWRTNV